jgi:hypothetical protein
MPDGCRGPVRGGTKVGRQRVLRDRSLVRGTVGGNGGPVEEGEAAHISQAMLGLTPRDIPYLLGKAEQFRALADEYHPPLAWRLAEIAGELERMAAALENRRSKRD